MREEMTDILFTMEDMGVIHQALGLVAALDASKVLDDIMDCHALALKCKMVQQKVDALVLKAKESDEWEGEEVRRRSK